MDPMRSNSLTIDTAHEPLSGARWKAVRLRYRLESGAERRTPRHPFMVPTRGSWRRRALGAALLAWLLLMPGAAARDDAKNWYKLATPNFELYGNGRDAEAKRLLRELESFRHVVSRFLGLTNVQRRPALVFFFKDDASFRPYKPRYEGKPSIVSGFHTEDPMDYALALGRQERGSTTMRVLFHEYTHLLTARQFRHLPVWAHEGVAEAFSTFEADDDRFDIGVALTNHVFLLRQNPPLPVERLLAIDRDAPDYNERSRAGNFYATSWLLAHYLLFAQQGFATNVFASYAALGAGTTNRTEAFRRAFGSPPAAFDARLRDYVQGGRYTVVRQTYPELESIRPRAFELSPGEIDLQLGRLLQMTGQGDLARPRLERAANLAPADPRPHEALALLAWRRSDLPVAQAEVDRALGLGSREAFLHFIAAELVYRGLSRQTDPARAAASLTQGRRLCEQAIQLDRWLAPAHHLLGIYVLAQNPRTPALAAVHVQEALRCDPLYQPALITWAALLVSEGNLGTARLILTRLLGGPLPDELRSVATRMAADIDRRLGTRP